MKEIEYKQALSDIEALWGSEPNTEDGRRLDELIEAVLGFEESEWGDL